MSKHRITLIVVLPFLVMVLLTACVTQEATKNNNQDGEKNGNQETQEGTNENENQENESADTSKEAKKDADFILSYALQSPATDNPEHNAAILFKEYVEAQSDGAVQIELYPGAQLGDERETFEAVRAGNIDFATQADGAVSGFVEEINVISIPYLFKSAPVAWEVLDGPFGQKLRDHILDETGVRPLSMAQNGFRSFSNSVRPIKTLEDIEGLKIRVMESQLYLNMVEDLGAQAVPMSGGDELYSALQQGVVDGQENPLDIIYAFNIHEVQDYITVDNHTFGSALLVTNNELFQSLPDEYQDIIIEGSKVWTSNLQGPKEEDSIRAIHLLEEEGVEVYPLPADEMERFREATQPGVIEWLEENIDSYWIEEIQAAVEEAEAKIYGN